MFARRPGSSPGAGGGSLDEHIDRRRVHFPRSGPVAGGHCPEDRALADARGREPRLEGGDGAAGGHAGPGEDDELGLSAGLVGLGAGNRDDQAVGMLGDLVHGESGELGAAEGGDEADEEQGPVAQGS